jgi:hypothetical protein
MKTRKITKLLQVTLFVALATLTTTGVAFADHANEAATITADYAPCEMSWVTESSALPSDVLDEICFATGRDATRNELTAETASPIPYDLTHEFTWLTDASAIPESVLREILFLESSASAVRKPDFGFVGPTLSTVDSLAYFEQYLFALELAEQGAGTVAPQIYVDKQSVERFEQYLAALESTEREWNASFASFDTSSWDYAREMERHAMSEDW